MGHNYPQNMHIRGPGRVWGVDTFFPGVVVPRSVSLAGWLGFRGKGLVQECVVFQKRL